MSGYVYFLAKPAEKSIVKIGYSARPEQRCKDLGIKHRDCRVIGWISAPRWRESQIHCHLYEKRIEGEWFIYDEEVFILIDGIISGSIDLDSLTHKFTLVHNFPKYLSQRPDEYWEVNYLWHLNGQKLYDAYGTRGLHPYDVKCTPIEEVRDWIVAMRECDTTTPHPMVMTHMPNRARAIKILEEK